MTGPRRFRNTPSAPRVTEGVPVAQGANEAVSKRIPDPLPKHPTADDVYYITGAWAPSCITAKEKRFTDAELAAEYWRKVGDYDACTEGYSTAMDGYNYESEEVEEGRVTTFLRFHSLPHYDEDDS